MTLERRYWDSDCFLGWLKAEPDKVEHCRQVLNHAERGDIQIITSTLTIAEVLNLKGRDSIEKSRRQQVSEFLRYSFIAPVSVTRRIAEHGRDLVWDNGIMPKDAVHVATACYASVTLLNTFDERLITKSGTVGETPLIIEKPTVQEPGLPGV